MNGIVQSQVELVSSAATGADATLFDAAPPWASLIVFLPLAAFVLCGLCAILPSLRRTKAPAILTVALLALSFVLTLMLYQQVAGGEEAKTLVLVSWEWFNLSWGDAPGQSFVANFGFYIDSLTVLWMLFVTGLATLIALYASEYMNHDVGLGYCRFFAAFSLFVFSMACLVMGDNLLLLYLGWEGVGLCSYLLIGYFYTEAGAVAAAKKAFIMNRIGDLGLALGIMLTFWHFGTIQYDELFPLLQPHIHSLQNGHIGDIPWVVQAIPLLLMVGAFGKSAQLPLYVWLPDAMWGPTPVSALIHAATMVTAGVYLIARMYPFFLVSDIALPIVAWVGALTALVAATIAMAQFDIKRIMAYSTVSQLGYMFCGLAFLSSSGAAFHVFTHAFFKATLFLCCGAVMHGFAGQLDLRRLSGVTFMKGWIVVGFAMLIGCLNLSGFPFTAGFFSKDMILAEAFVTPGPGYGLLGWILLITAGLTAYYTFRVFFRVFVGPKLAEPGDEHHGDADHEFHPHAPGLAINSVLAVLAICSILAAGTYFINTENHGWVGGMVHNSTGAELSAGEGDHAVHAAAFRDDLHDLAHGPDEAAGVTADPAGEGGDHAVETHVAHGSFLGRDPHAVMYYVSSIVGLLGILTAAYLHGPKGIGGLMIGSRTTAERSRADDIAPKLGPVQRWAQGKWFVDEFYNAFVVVPMWALGHIFHLFDQLVIDGIVNLFGKLPSMGGKRIQPTQSGLLHGYALSMASGLALVLLLVWLLTF